VNSRPAPALKTGPQKIACGESFDGNPFTAAAFILRRTHSTEYQMTRLALILAAVFGLSACETIKGAGQDLQSAGQTIESEAAESQANM